ncbi:putative F-box domain-containing protein [Medicago truncatula]|uniref:F-box and associated interaction domain protein, putative n=1 Tax=Medicago truncatula TaxID=3880 RepID=G7K4W8_MEDTR|nr:F-box and associated interaction domain protein, putative [Medicago truncatula]RHN58131.1 putative F-box domain-containing protein [Medicago truncatula]
MKRFVVVVSTNETAKVIKTQYIHDDIAFSILSKLPIKSTKRFECVCKSWSLLFDNPNFISAYGKGFLTKDHSIYDDTSLLLHKKNTCSFCWFGNRAKLDWPRPLPGYVSGFDILGSGSVHGILCLVCAYKENIILWNPSTKEFKLIPPSPYSSGPYWEA